jgi:3-deoxy-D-manno-octulosonic-acid transferase
VRNGAELGTRVAALLADQPMRVEMGSHGRAVVDRNRGALEKLLRLIDSLLRS